MTLEILIQAAYGASRLRRSWLPVQAAPQRGMQVQGGPSWIRAERYDVIAKTEPEQEAAMQLMLRTLLEQRFQLKLHRETKDLPVYALTAAKGGFKLKQGSCAVFDPKNPPPPRLAGQQPPNYCGNSRLGRKGLDWTLDGMGMSMTELAGTLAILIGPHAVVIDKTGFTGTFDAHLEYTPGLGEPGESDVPASPAKGPVGVLVIDHVEKPSAN